MINRRTFAKQLLSVIGLSTVPVALGETLTSLIEAPTKVAYPIVFTEFEKYMIEVLTYEIDKEMITQICKAANHTVPVFPHEDELFTYDGALLRVKGSITLSDFIPNFKQHQRFIENLTEYP